MSKENDRLAEVKQRCEQLVDQRLLRGGTDRALAIARETYKEAMTPPGVPQPWRALAAYRLAHLLMRSGSSDAAQQAEALFREAEDSRTIRPMAAIYRVAALLRAGQNELLSEALANARLCVARTAGSDEVEFQDPFTNLLEFAHYVSGEPYAPMEGYCPLFADLGFATSEWTVASEREGAGTIRMPRALAVEELEARAARSQSPVVFLIDEGETKWFRNGKWERGVDARAILQPLIQRHSLFADHESGDSRRKGRQRLKEEIKKVVGRPITLDPQPEPELNWVGAYNRRILG